MITVGFCLFLDAIRFITTQSEDMTVESIPIVHAIECPSVQLDVVELECREGDDWK